MNNRKLLLTFFLILITNSIAQTFIPPGDVSGTWLSTNSPYYIQGEITIPNSETLTIEPGVEVVFMGHYKFNVQGRLIAIGTLVDSIRFTAANTDSGWHGIRFINTQEANDTSKLIYCSFKYGKANTGGYSSNDRCGGAIMIYGFDKVLISYSLLESNMNNGDISPTIGGAAIFIQYASPTITANTFRNNSGTTDCAILCTYSSIYNPDANPIITNNLFLNNSGPHGPVTCCYNKVIISGNFISGNFTTRAGGGIFTLTTNALITNNIIINNQCFGGEGEGGGIKCWVNDSSIIINNTIAYNSATHGGGICCNQNSDPIFINNIIWGNIATYGNQVNLLEATSDPDFFYCDIQGGKEGFGGNGAGNNYNGLYENNIDSDPLFADATNNDFHLSEFSPCIGAGIDSIEINNNWYFAPFFDYYGNPRPNPPECMPDIGALESALCSPATTISVNPTELNFGEVAIDSSSTMTFTITNTGNADLEVTNISSSEPAFTVNMTSVTVPPGNDQDVEVTFTPTEGIPYNGIIELVHNAVGSPDSVIVTGDGVTGVEEELQPLTFSLEQNYPNPFNPNTTIKYSIPEISKVSLTLFNLLSEEVTTLVNEEKNAGIYEVEFNASTLPSGVYFYQLKAGEFIQIKKMVFIK